MEVVGSTADVVVMSLSVYAQDDTAAWSLDMGAVDYLVKPFSPTELAARVRPALRQRREPFEGEPSASCQAASCVNRPRKKSPVGVDRAS